MKRKILLLTCALCALFASIHCQAAITVKVKIPSSWSASYGIYVYYWNTTAGTIDWPGAKMNPLGSYWYSYTLPEGVTKADIIFNDGNYNYYKTVDITNVTASTCFEVGQDRTYNSSMGEYSYAYQVVDCPTVETYTMRLDPFSVDWEQAYLFVRNGSDYYVSMPALLDSEGWYSASFDGISDNSYQIAWGTSINEYRGSFVSEISASTCFEYSDYSYVTTTCRDLNPNESNTYTVHVATAGTFGQLMVQKLGDKTWTDVVKLVVTGSLNEDDLHYIGRMTQMQQLDLSGTDLTAMGNCADLKRLTSVVLPNTCVTINNEAFQYCSRLSSINLSNIQTIGTNAFAYCRLENVNLPVVTSISSNAFENNQKLLAINMPLVQSIGYEAFYNCDALTQVDLSNVTSLGESAFRSCENLSTVTLSEELQTIPHYCFYYCTNLKSIVFPKALKSIGEGALPNLSGDIVLPDGLQSVGRDNFIWDASSVTIPASVTSWSSFSSNWKDVYCHVIVPQSFSAFNTSNAASMTLHVPAISLSAYKLHDNWYQFGKIVAMDGNVDELNITGEFTLLTTDGIANKANVILNSGAILTVTAENAMAAGNYVQQIGSFWSNDSYWTYDENGNGYYQYYYYMNGTGMLLANSAMTADAVAVKLIPYSDRWNFFSLPFDVNMSDITVVAEGSGEAGTSQWVIREYSGANRASGNGATWNNVPANGQLKANTGYILYWTVENGYNMTYYFNMPAVKNSKMQNIFATGDVDVALTEYSAEFPQNRSWNLVGNPYPCAFAINQMDCEAPITAWNGYNYVAYTAADDDYLLRPAEGFFVQAPQGVSKITFHKEGRAAAARFEMQSNNSNYYAPARNAQTAERKVFNFTLANKDYSDRARLVLNEKASKEYELTRDASKMMSSDKSVPQLYVNDNGIRYAIDERPEQSAYTLGAYIGKAGEYTIHVNVPQNEDRQIILTDTQTGVATDLTVSDYTFTTEAGTFDSRFVISFVQRVASGLENGATLVTPMKTMQNGQLIITTPQGKNYTVGGIEL